MCKMLYESEVKGGVIQQNLGGLRLVSSFSSLSVSRGEYGRAHKVIIHAKRVYDLLPGGPLVCLAVREQR